MQAIISYVMHVYKISKINMLKWTYGLFTPNYRVATLSTFTQTVPGIIIPYHIIQKGKIVTPSKSKKKIFKLISCCLKKI